MEEDSLDRKEESLDHIEDSLDHIETGKEYLAGLEGSSGISVIVSLTLDRSW